MNNTIHPPTKENEVSFKPLYLREKNATAMYGIGRTNLYRLAKEGKIKSITLQEEGCSRGTRLFCVKSIERYILSFDKEIQSEESTA